jgi:hypothetical protein
MSATTVTYEVFLSCPMAGLKTDQRYQDLRAEALEVTRCLEEECGLSVFFAGRDLEDRAAFGAPDFSVVTDIEALKQSRYFLLLYPERLVSSVLVEAGIALALGKKAVYFVRDSKHLPFMLRHIDRVYPVKIYEYRGVDRILKLLREHRGRLFEPWREPAPAGPPTAAPAGTRLDLQADRRIGPYTLVRQIGAGACGFVWLAERRSSLATTQVALKFQAAAGLDVAAVRREAELWVQASGHPNVLPVIEAEVYEGWLVIVSPYAPHGSLRDWLTRHGGRAPTVAQALDLGVGILAGLGHLHGRRLVHRDLKPANVLLEGDCPRIADFGLARVLQSCDQTQTVAGTPTYMAPEAWEGERSPAADLWSVGVMLYEMLAGRPPFPETDLNALRRAVRQGEPPPLPSVPGELAAVVARALARDPAQRFPSAAEMAATLSRLPAF